MTIVQALRSASRKRREEIDGRRQARERLLAEQRRKQHSEKLFKEEQARKAKAAGKARLKKEAQARLNALAAMSKPELKRLNEKLRASRDFSDDVVEVKPAKSQPKPAFRPAGGFNSLSRQQPKPSRNAAAPTPSQILNSAADKRQPKPSRNAAAVGPSQIVKPTADKPQGTSVAHNPRQKPKAPSAALSHRQAAPSKAGDEAKARPAARYSNNV